MANLVVSNITHRPTRTLVSSLAVAIGVVLVLIAVGLSHGLINDVVTRTQNVGADILFQPTGASLLFALNTGTLPMKLTDRLREFPGIRLATPVLIHFSTSDFGLVFGIDPVTFNQFPGHLQLVEGSMFTDKYDVIVDETFAKSKQVKIGDRLELLGGHTFRIAGICRSGLAVVRVFILLSTMQEIKGTPNQVSMVFLKCTSPETVDKVYNDMKTAFAGYTITKSDEIFAHMSSNLPGLRQFTLTVITISALVSFLVILLAMYTTILERTREIGILKSLGASKLFIIGEILEESLLICALGIGVGIGLSYLVKKAIIATFPTLQVDIPLDWLVKASLLGIISGTLGALYPAYKAARQDPVQALMYE
jgi:putative ABC transport system permease protein